MSMLALLLLKLALIGKAETQEGQPIGIPRDCLVVSEKIAGKKIGEEISNAESILAQLTVEHSFYASYYCSDAEQN